MAGPGEHGSVFSNIIIFVALSAPTALYPLVIAIHFAKIRKTDNHFLKFFKFAIIERKRYNVYVMTNAKVLLIQNKKLVYINFISFYVTFWFS